MESGMNTTGFGYYLRDIRENAKISMRRLAQETQLDPGYLSRMEREMSPAPRVEIIQRIAKALCDLQSLPTTECEKLKRNLLDSSGQLTANDDLVYGLKERFAERLKEQGVDEDYIIDAVNKVDIETMGRVLSGEEKLEIAYVDSYTPLPPRRMSKATNKTKLQAGSRAFIEVDGDLTSHQEELLKSVANTIRFILRKN